MHSSDQKWQSLLQKKKLISNAVILILSSKNIKKKNKHKNPDKNIKNDCFQHW